MTEVVPFPNPLITLTSQTGLSIGTSYLNSNCGGEY